MNKVLFYFLSLTWGLPITLVGLLVALVLRVAGYKPQKYGYCLHFSIGKTWGGCSLGMVILTGTKTTEDTKMHEHGHALQNCYWGILFPFVIAIPSAARYLYRAYLIKSGKTTKKPLADYDAIWFEGDATRRGIEFIKNLGENKNVKNI